MARAVGASLVFLVVTVTFPLGCSRTDGPAPGEDGGGDGDADNDAEDERDSGRTDGGEGDGATDADEPPWDPLAGCSAGESEERWLVVAAAGGELRSYLTDRDCGSPEELCAGCVATAFSPSGERALAFVPSADPARVSDEILVLDLDAGHAVVARGFSGALPTWIDDETLAYLAAPESWRGSCGDVSHPPTPETVELRRRTIASGAEAPVVAGLRRAWTTCCPVVSDDGRSLGLAEDVGATCASSFGVVSVVVLDSGEVGVLDWSQAGRDNTFDAPVGLLPGGDAFLVQTATGSGQSTLYATTFAGRATRVAGPFPAGYETALPLGAAAGRWADCAAVRRVGPACEVYCRDPDAGLWQRRRLVDGAVEPVDCSELGGDLRIMDVRQVPAG